MTRRWLAYAAVAGHWIGGCTPSNTAPPLAALDTGAAEVSEIGDGGAAKDAPGAETFAPDTSSSPDTAMPDTSAWTGGWQCPVAAEPPCGGALEGSTWTIVDFCPEDPTAAAALFEHPYGDLPACQPPGGSVQGNLVDSGEIAFVDGEMVLDIGGYAETTYTFSPACLAAAKPGQEPAAACAAMSKADLMACSFAGAGSGSGTCTCHAKIPKEGGKSKFPYAIVAGTTLKAGSEFSAGYCVQGDRLVLDVSPHIVSWRWWLLKRK